MNLKKYISSNRIEKITIDGTVVKINDTTEIENNFPIENIQKIYLKAKKQNLNLVFLILMTVAIAFVAVSVSVKVALALLFSLLVTLFVSNFSLNQKKYSLYIKLEDNNAIYSIPFNVKIKEEILNVIWEIKRVQFEATSTTN